MVAAFDAIDYTYFRMWYNYLSFLFVEFHCR